ncbi:hypothetical protein [Apilactobacillus quenuiae]|uniref:hypothetical protein n=1 Tax=Apilactobacillus quenuiae TaxID=2008377 RepID=UPI001300035A|nr:hypothetical protein [Apilactobacillus quenuiae]
MDKKELSIIQVEDMVSNWLNSNKKDYRIKNVQQTTPWVPNDEIVLSIRCKRK